MPPSTDILTGSAYGGRPDPPRRLNRHYEWIRFRGGGGQYRSQTNDRRIDGAGLVSRNHFRRAPGKPLPAPRQKANAARSSMTSAIEHVFDDRKDRMRLFVRTIGLARARTKIGLANVTHNFRRLAWRQNRGVPP